MISSHFCLKVHDYSSPVVVNLWKFLKVYLGGFFEISNSFFKRGALAYSANLRALGNEEIVFLMHYRS